MPWLKGLPTWFALNNVNSSSESAITDPDTGQAIYAGGLNLGDYTDFDNAIAASLSYTTNGILYEGRYRYVQVDSGATAANVKTGTVGYARSGQTLKTAVITSAGSGQTNGATTLNANAGSGGGSGAVLSVTIAGGLITSVSVTNGGAGYVSPPTFTVAQGGTPGTIVGQLGVGVNLVTSADQALAGVATAAGIGPVHPVVFLNSITPGNFGFVQEMGVATVLSGAVVQSVNTFAIVKNSSADGTMTTSSATFGPFALGMVIDPLAATPPANTPFKVFLSTPMAQG